MKHKIKKIFKKALPALEILLVMIVIWASITFILTYINSGFWENFVNLWLKWFIFAFFLISPIALSSTFVYGFIIEKLFWNKLSDVAKKITLSICIWFTIELVMSFITIFNNIWFNEWFFISWMTLYIKSLPLGIVVWLVMSFIVKPWLGRHKV